MHYISLKILDELNAAFTGIETNDVSVTGRIETFICKRMVGGEKKLYKLLEQQYKDNQNLISSVSEILSSTSNVINSAKTTSAELETNCTNTRKILLYLISTLNLAFPDHDFSTVRAEHFQRMRIVDARKCVRNWFQMIRSGGGGSSGSGGGGVEEASDMEDTQQDLFKRFWIALESIVGPNSKGDITDLEIKPLPENGKKKRQRIRTTSLVSIPSSDWDSWDSEVEIYSYEPDDASGAGDPYEEDDDSCTGTVWRFFYFFYNRKWKRLLFFTMKASPIVVDNSSLAWEEETEEVSPLPSEYSQFISGDSLPPSPSQNTTTITSSITTNSTNVMISVSTSAAAAASSSSSSSFVSKPNVDKNRKRFLDLE